MKKILVAYLSTLDSCPRARRIVEALEKSNEITVLSYDVDLIAGCRQLRIDREQVSLVQKLKYLNYLLAGSYAKYLQAKSFGSIAPTEFYDVIICHDILLLPVIVYKFSYGKLILDAREYYPRQFEGSLLWRMTFGRLNHWVCSHYLRAADARITVSNAIAKLYEQVYGVSFRVYPSYPRYHHLRPSLIESSSIRLVHHGVTNRNRKLEVLIDMMKYLPGRYILDLYLVPTDKRYYQYLIRRAKGNPRIRFRDRVSPDKLISTLNEYDIGIIASPGDAVNIAYSLPNKFFEYVQARLAIVSTPLSEITAWLAEYQIGIVSGDFSPKSIAETLRVLSAKRIAEIKNRSHGAAYLLSQEAQLDTLKQLINKEPRLTYPNSGR